MSKEISNIKPSEESPEAAPAPATAAKDSTGIVGMLGDIAVMAVVAFVVSLGAIKYLPKTLGLSGASGDLPVATIQFDALVREQIVSLSAQVSSGELAVEEMPKRSSAFTAALLEKLKARAAEGKVIMRAEAVIAAPADVPDYTDQFRSELIADGLLKPSSKK